MDGHCLALTDAQDGDFRQAGAREGKTPSRISLNCRSNDNKTSNALLVFKVNDVLPSA
jgi:hypothetical protein